MNSPLGNSARATTRHTRSYPHLYAVAPNRMTDPEDERVPGARDVEGDDDSEKEDSEVEEESDALIRETSEAAAGLSVMPDAPIDNGGPVGTGADPEQDGRRRKLAETAATVGWRDLPRKKQLIVITLARLSEPLVQTSLQVMSLTTTLPLYISLPRVGG